jgi:hypothetical protein
MADIAALARSVPSRTMMLFNPSQEVATSPLSAIRTVLSVARSVSAIFRVGFLAEKRCGLLVSARPQELNQPFFLLELKMHGPTSFAVVSLDVLQTFIRASSSIFWTQR